jgi:hypothetical protein
MVELSGEFVVAAGEAVERKWTDANLDLAIPVAILIC